MSQTITDSLVVVSDSDRQGEDDGWVKVVGQAPKPVRRFNRIPTPEETSTIESMLEEDQALLKILQDHESRREAQITRFNQDIEERRRRLEGTKARYSAATQLYDKLEKSMWLMKNTAGIDPSARPSNQAGLALNKPILSDSMERQLISFELLSNSLKDASEALRETREEVALAEEGLQAALGILAWNEGRSNHYLKHIESVKVSLSKTRAPLRAIFRVPVDIWESIFYEIVQEDGVNEFPADPEKIHGNRAVILSSVCHTWRSMVTSLPSLWQYIFIRLDNSFKNSIPRLRLHAKYCRSLPPIVTIYAIEGACDVQMTEPIFSKETVPLLQSLYCHVLKSAYESVSELLKQLPSPVALLLRAHYQESDSTYISLPTDFLLKVETFTQHDVLAEWTSPSGDILETAHGPGLVEYVPSFSHMLPIPRWLLSNPQRLRRLEVNSRQLVTSSLTMFPLLEELKVPLDYLQRINDGDNFPVLTKIAISNTCWCQQADFESMPRVNTDNICELAIQEICTHVTPNHVSGMVTFIRRFANLHTLELQRATARFVLDHLISLGEAQGAPVTLPVERIVIRSLEGEANFLTSFVERRLAIFKGSDGAGEPVGESGKRKFLICPKLREIEFANCPKISQEMRTNINNGLDLTHLVNKRPALKQRMKDN